METTMTGPPKELEIWGTCESQPQEWPEKQITWNPKEYYLHGIHSGYRARSSFEWLFHFIQDKGFTNHKKERVLKILFRYKGRGIMKVQEDPQVFVVVSEPEHKKRNGMWEMAHAYRVMIDRWGRFFCPCEWNMTTSLETCTHILALRGFIQQEDDREQQTSTLQGESEVCAH